MPEFGKRQSTASFDIKDWDVWIPQERYESLMRWLQSHGADEWHGCARTWNYGHGSAPIAWICMQDQCDAATAQDVFWKCNGAEHFEGDRILRSNDPAQFDGGFALARLIAQRWRAGSYTRKQLRLPEHRLEEIKEDFRRYLTNVAGRDTALPWTAPRPEQAVDGYVVDEEFFREGFPATLSPDLNESREIYVRALSSKRHWCAKWGWESPPYWFGVKLGWITASEIPVFRE